MWTTRFFAPDTGSSSTASAAAALAAATASASANAMAERDAAAAPGTSSGGASGGSGSRKRVLPSADHAAMEAAAKELSALGHDLCLLYARRAVLSILARCMTSLGRQQLEGVRRCLSLGDGEGAEEISERSQAEKVQTFLCLLKLASAEGPHLQLHLTALALQRTASIGAGGFAGGPGMGTARSLSPSSLPYIDAALQAGGAPALHAIAPAVVNAIVAARESGQQYVLEQLCDCVYMQVLLASSREYTTYFAALASRTSTDAGSAALTKAAKERSMSDAEALALPNLSLATWLTGLLLQLPQLPLATPG
ncbi:unnamed protein product, partial [Chrysoparadoxa australica]